MNQTLTTEQAARFLGVNPATLAKYVREGLITRATERPITYDVGQLTRFIAPIDRECHQHLLERLEAILRYAREPEWASCPTNLAQVLGIGRPWVLRLIELGHTKPPFTVREVNRLRAAVKPIYRGVRYRRQRL